MVARKERLQVGLRTPDGVDDEVGAETVGERADGFDRIGVLRVDRVRGSKLSRPLELALDHVNADDQARSGDRCARDGRVAHAAAADHGDAVAGGCGTGVDGGPETGHHAAADQGRRLGPYRRVNRHRLAGVHQAQLREGADPERRGQLGAVVEAHALARVAAVEAIPRAPAAATPARPARRAPGDHHRLAAGHVVDARSDGLHAARRLMAEKVGEVISDAAFAIVEVGVADPAGNDPDQGFTGPGQGHAR